MNKAILVIDMPNCCEDCSLMWRDDYSDFCPVKCNKNKTDIYDYTHTSTKPDWCPLRPIPDKMYEGGTWTVDGYVEDGFHSGWNACIEEILWE